MRSRPLLALAAVVAVAACTDSPVTSPNDGIVSGPSFAISDAGNGGAVEGFWFLPPLAKQVTVEGEFDDSYAPSMQVCELAGNPSAIAPGGDPSVGCVEPLNIVTAFGPGSAAVSGSAYQFSWDTSPGATGNLSAMDPDKFYRISISIDGSELGYLDVNPQRPSGQSPGEDYDDLYAFRLGETLPVKFFVNVQARCSLAGEEVFVIQCVAQGVIDQNGGVVTLESEQTDWAKISTVVPAGALPDGYPEIILTMERIDPILFAQENGGIECIPGLLGLGGFDAPQFGGCLRITTVPELDVDLDLNAFIDFCVDFNPTDFPSLKFLEEQDLRLQIIRYTDDGLTQGLPNVDATTCDPFLPSASVRGFFPVPSEEGFVRTAAVAANRVSRFLAPEPLAAHGSIRLSGSTSGFSRFSWALPGQMLKEAGDNVVIQQFEDGSESYDVGVQVRVVDAGTEPGDLPDFSLGLPPSNVEGATVNFEGAAGVVPGEVLTGSDGVAAAVWTVPGGAPGVYTMDAKALGLLDAAVPDHAGGIDFQEEAVTFTATVVGLPSSATQSPLSPDLGSGLPGETLLTPLTVTVVDQNGEPVVGFPVTWSALCSADPLLCDGFVSNDTDGDSGNDDGSHLVTDQNGQATGYWTLATVPAQNTLTVTVGSQQLGFTAATWTAVAGCEVTVDGDRATVSGEWDCALEAGNRLAFVANISGGDAPAEVRWQTDADSIYFLVLVEQGSMEKRNSLRIDFDNTLDGPSADDDAIGYDADSGFFDEYLTSRCVNRSQSGCGEADTNGVDGTGALGNDGLYTVYELSHPLAGDGVQDIDVSPGSQLGFYLTLRVGNGAQGNTQVPGFRDPLVITIN